MNKEQILNQFKNQLIQTNKYLVHIHKTNKLITLNKNIKISSYILKKLIPYLLTLSITTGIFSSVGLTPFYRDKKKEKNNLISNKNANCYNKCIIYEKWKKIDENAEIYYREVKIFKIDNDIDYSTINLNNNIEYILGEIVDYKIEVNNNITNEELSKEPYIELIYNEFKISLESKNINYLTTIFWTVSNAVIMLLLNKEELENIRDTIENIKYDINIIKKTYPNLSPNELQQIEEIHLQNYKYLKRK